MALLLCVVWLLVPVCVCGVAIGVDVSVIDEVVVVVVDVAVDCVYVADGVYGDGIVENSTCNSDWLHASSSMCCGKCG